MNVIDVSGLDDRDLDRLLAGKAPVSEEAAISQALAEVTAFSAALPAADVASAHVRAMTNLAREVAMLPEQAPVVLASRRTSRWATHRPLVTGLAGAALALPLCVAAIAAAGVSIPHAVRSPYEAVGIALPNQAQPRVVTATLRGARTGKGDRHNAAEPSGGAAGEAHQNGAAPAGAGKPGAGGSGGQGGASSAGHGPPVAATNGSAANAGAQAGTASGAGAPSSEAAGGQAGAQAEGGSSGNANPAEAGAPSAPSGGGHPSSGAGSGSQALPKPAGGGHTLPAPSSPVVATRPGNKDCQDGNGLLDLGGVLSGRGPLQLLEEQCPTPHR